MTEAHAAQFAGDELWDPAWEEAAGERTVKARSATTGSEVTLYTSWFCPFAQRAWIALEELKVPYKYVEINPYEVDPEKPGGYTKKALPLSRKREMLPDFVAASPRGLVPAVDHAGRKIWESIHVVDYLDGVFGGSLVPRDDPYTAAMVRIWSDHCTDRIQRGFYTALMEQDETKRPAALETFYDECRSLARAMDVDGPYFLGDRFSLVDIALAPFWLRFEWVGGHYRNLTFPDDADFERLQRWAQATLKRPSVAATIVCKPRLIASYSHYAKNEGTSDFAKGMQSRLSSN